MAEWIQIGLAVLTIAGSVAGSLAAVSFKSGSRLSKIDAAILANATAIENLISAVEQRATKETATGLQAQLTRQEGQISANLADVNARIDRHGARVEKVEETHALRESATAAILGRLEAGFNGLKESVDRLIAAEALQRQTPAQQPNLIDQLRGLVELQRMLKAAA